MWFCTTLWLLSPGYGTCLNLDEEKIARAPIVNASSNLKVSQDVLDRAYLSLQADTLKIDNAMVYQMLSKMFSDSETFVYVKQIKSTYP